MTGTRVDLEAYTLGKNAALRGGKTIVFLCKLGVIAIAVAIIWIVNQGPFFPPFGGVE